MKRSHRQDSPEVPVLFETQDSPEEAGAGSNLPSTSPLIQSMEGVIINDVHVTDNDSQSSIASLTRECHQLFQAILTNIQQSDEFEVVETQFGRLNIWASNIGAVADGNSSLDYRLRLSDDIKSMVVQLLEVLKGSLCRLGKYKYPNLIWPHI
ncbi:hypothetical protein TWF718_010098 [Orbilia javanica]|uniref:Uncharacterized protein n=1 Tax=Orbilia javanica TaxID=47235 RepID=A0AAN8NP15_9PEZI